MQKFTQTLFALSAQAKQCTIFALQRFQALAPKHKKIAIATFAGSVMLTAIAISQSDSPASSEPNTTITDTTPQYATELINPKKLTVVSVASPSIIFQSDEMMHGFAYDLTRLYAAKLKLDLDFQVVDSEQTAQDWLKQGKADVMVSQNKIAQQDENSSLRFISLACGEEYALSKNGLNTHLNWVFHNKHQQLTDTAETFVCKHKKYGTLYQLATFYNQKLWQPHDWKTVQNNLQQRLPDYESKFKTVAQQYNLDWHLLAAIGYQESFLKPTSVSPTGVRGLMMLTSETAKEMGVNNRDDAMQSIEGGAKYFHQLMQRYQHIAEPDRTWFALAAYNLGPAAVLQIQNRVKAQGQNPYQWVYIFDYLRRNQSKNAKYEQAIQYVTRIRTFVELLKKNEQAAI